MRRISSKRAHATLDDVLELDHTQHARLLHGAIGAGLCFSNHQRGAARPRNAINGLTQLVIV